MKRLVISCSYGYGYAELRPFIESLKETGTSADIVLLVANTSPETIAELTSRGVKPVPFSYPWKKIRNPLYRLWPAFRPLISVLKQPDAIAAASAPFQNLLILRNLLFRDFLKRNAYDDILIVDLRDVSFQHDPFAASASGKLRAYLEEPPLTLGTCRFNARWMREVFGEGMLARLHDKPIACGGSIRADGTMMSAYLDEFVRTLPSMRSTMRVGADQAVHNVVVYERFTGNVEFLPNRSSEVLTMGRMPRDEDWRRDEAGRLLDGTGTPYAVLHQYDRHESLKHEIRTRYA